ncbi:MAG: hypothetical protein WCJ54_08870, partial [Actinomycetota bacterium]
MAGIKKIAPHIALFNTLDSFANEHQLTEDPYISGLSNAVLNRKNLPMWASLNPLEFLPHAPVNVNKVLHRVQSWMVIARNTLVFLPVALTWLAISKATSAFAVYTSSNTLSVVNFLDFWENGYGVLSKTWSLSTIATLDFQIILLIISLTVAVALMDRKLKGDLLVETQAADEERIRLAIVITSYLFNNILGNLLLIAGIIVVGMMDFRMAIGLAAIFIILYQAFSLSKKSGSSTLEGFTEWSADLKNKFLKFENTYNPNIQFDINIIQQQASPEEVEYLLKNNKWPWSESVKTMYQDAIMRNSMISIDPGVAMDVAQTIYNETAVKELLSWNTKEGVFLLSGVTIGHTDGLPDNVNNIVRCGNNDDGDAVMEKIVNVGYDGINGSMIQNITPVNNADIPTLVDGFKFLKEGMEVKVSFEGDEPILAEAPV